MLQADLSGDDGIVGVHSRASAKGGLDKARCAGACAARTAAGATRTRARTCGPKCADAASARRVLHNTSIDAPCNTACLGAKDVGFRDRDVVAGNGKIEVVFQRECDSVLQGNFKHAVMDECVQTGRVRQVGGRHGRGQVRVKRIV